VRPDTFDHPGTQILLDAFEGTGWDNAEMLGLELQAMGPIVDPPASAFDVFTRGDRRCCADDRDEVFVATDFDPEDAKARLLAVERDTFDRTGEVFRRMRVW
jgi:hypothetical protein